MCKGKKEKEFVILRSNVGGWCVMWVITGYTCFCLTDTCGGIYTQFLSPPAGHLWPVSCRTVENCSVSAVHGSLWFWKREPSGLLGSPFYTYCCKATNYKPRMVVLPYIPHAEWLHGSDWSTARPRQVFCSCPISVACVTWAAVRYSYQDFGQRLKSV